MHLYASAREVTRNTAALLQQSTLTPAAAAEEYLKDHVPPWDPSVAPMMIEPLNMMASRRYTQIVYVGPARSSKTMTFIIGGVAYLVKCAPGDFQITQMSKEAARDFSQTDLDRALRNASALREALSPRAQDDNTFDKVFRSGIRGKIAWPAASQLAGKTLRYAFSTDYDRPENRDNVDGEGPLWDQQTKRVQTYMSRGKSIAESSPKAEYLDPKWEPRTPHEAPPAKGILELYNRGTRARWYWRCQGCGARFEASPGLGLFHLPPLKDLEKRVRETDPLTLAEEYARVACVRCGNIHTQNDRRALNLDGKWLHDGERFEADDTITGERRATKMVSYWQGGASAAFQSWSDMLMKYFQALSGYLANGEEGSLRATTNMDQAAPYLPRVAMARRSSDELKQRAEAWDRGVVPAGVRFLIAAVDVQGNRFVVHVFGWGVGLEGWLVDRFKISSSRRPEGDRTAALQPAAYLEDWHCLLSDVMQRRYPVAGTDMKLPIRLTLCDSGGEAGVTAKAYDFFRYLKRERKHRRFRLVKGARPLDAPTARLSYPDAQDRKDRKAGARGDVPVWMLNTNVLKDAVMGDLARVEVGPGYFHIPKWVEKDFYDELAAEERTEKGWKNPNNARNEALDLHVYARAGCKIMRADRINWLNPPNWARPVAEQILAEPEAVSAGGDDGDDPPPPPVAPQPRPQKHWSQQPRRKGWAKNW